MQALLRSVLVSAVLVSAILVSAMSLGGCASESDTCEGPGCFIGGKGDGAEGRQTEVLLTAPYCDVCTAEDKDVLLARSPVLARVVELIDGAEHSIDVAQYTFSRREIEEALVRAHERGVSVRIAMDQGQARDGSLSRRLIDDHGLDVRFIQGAPSGSRFGLVHTKFMIVDDNTLLTGSNNWSSTGVSINEENTIVVEAEPGDPIVQGFACHFARIWDGDHDGAGDCSNGPVAFTPGSAARNLIRDALRDAEFSIEVLMHHLVFDDLVDELADAAERGVRVRVLVNEADRAEHTRGNRWARFFAAGGQMRFKRGNAEAYQIMHHKLAIVDGRILLNGSGNWSGSGFFANYENYVRWESRDVVEPFNGLFARLWRWSLEGESLDAGRTAAEQDARATNVYFGNLHAHIEAGESPDLLDDGHAHVVDDEGMELPSDVSTSVPEATRYALEYARDRGGLDFLALTPHCTDDDPADGPTQADMTPGGFDQLRRAAAEVTEQSDGAFLGLAGMEWSTNSTGNHLNVLGSREIANVERGRFDLLYGEFLPQRDAQGDFPVVMMNHPRTFQVYEDTLNGNWDQVYDVLLTDIPNNSQRTKKFNDFGLDDYPPLSEVRQSWLDGTAMPDRAVVAETLQNLRTASARWTSLMEVTVGRGNEFGTETPMNPSLTTDEETGDLTRFTKVHTDYDYYLSQGFRIAPTASHDNHFANWGTGHTSRTAVFAEALTEVDLLRALRDRAVYASEDEDLEMRFYVDGRVRMGEEMATRAASVNAQLWLADPNYAGPYAVRIWAGQIGGDIGLLGERDVQAGWNELPVALLQGEQVVYLEVLEVEANRMAWSAPIWIERIEG